jgi:hypothetical protein
MARAFFKLTRLMALLLATLRHSMRSRLPNGQLLTLGSTVRFL